LLAGLLLASNASRAIDWERLVMPGPLAGAHAEYESDCASCHQAFNALAQRSLCLDCHQKVAADVEGAVGFHGRHPLASSGQCRSCHPDHLGRAADIRGLSESTFDHAMTDYPLAGAHRSTACVDCHPPAQARREAPEACVECHREQDAHRGALGTDCGDCHDEVAWRAAHFDHEETGYRLVGAHADASCVGCHVGAAYEGTPTDCVACHSIDDAHAGRFGRDCGECHSPSGWVRNDFDHARESGFALEGAHAEATCVTCHRQAPGERALPEDCSGCHASDDRHADRFGSDCGDCHRPSTWKRVLFDHEASSDFALVGAHGRTACESCHVGPVAQGQMDSRCVACHGSDDVHRGELGEDCADCHDPLSFAGRVRFDHGLTPFPLLGLHAMATCESCHADHRYRETASDCVDCHRLDDRHSGTLGERCGMCHNPNAWDVWRFDHAERTRFPLEGAHEGLACGGCHRKRLTAQLRMVRDCVGCHSSDDPHRGEFGRDCDSCHSSTAWRPAALGRGRRRLE
jgi:hypothetical protein